MKKFTAILFLILLCGCNEINSHFKGYNPETDALVNRYLSTKDFKVYYSKYGDKESYCLISDSLRFDIYKEIPVKFEKAGNVKYFGTMIDGENLCIDADLSSLTVSDKTKIRLLKYARNHEISFTTEEIVTKELETARKYQDTVNMLIDKCRQTRNNKYCYTAERYLEKAEIHTQKAYSLNN